MESRNYPRYAIFDMDGTLIDSMQYWRSAWYEYCLMRELLPQKDCLPLKGLPWDVAAKRVQEQYGLDLRTPEHKTAMFDLILSHYRRDVAPYRNVVEVLRGIAETGGRAAVVTATPHPWCDEALRHFGLTELLSAVIAPDDNGGVGKHDPSIFRLALERLGCEDPGECTVYEDALYSIRTAKAMGFSIVAVLDPTAECDRTEILSLADGAITPVSAVG